MAFSSALIRGREPRTLARLAAAALAPPPPGEGLGFVYASDHLTRDLDGILEALKLDTGVQRWVGGVAVGVCGDAGVCFDEPAIAVMVGSVHEQAFLTFALGESDEEPDQELERALPAAWREQHGPCVTLLHADPRSPGFEGSLRTLGEEGFVVGGLLSSRSSYLHVADTVHEGSASGIVFAADVAVATGLSQGCSPIGARHTVTRCDGQLLLELDHRPAAQVLREEVSGAAGEIPAGALHVAVTMPGDDGRDYLVRNLLGLDADSGAVAVGELLQPGQRVMFCRRDAASAAQDLTAMLQGLARRLPSAPQGAVYVSCLARGPNLFAEPDGEITAIREAFPDMPVVGFFANGEFSRDRLYAYTGVLTVFL
jgi:small ligand-binding sensory domain FIST